MVFNSNELFSYLVLVGLCWLFITYSHGEHLACPVHQCNFKEKETRFTTRPYCHDQVQPALIKNTIFQRASLKHYGIKHYLSNLAFHMN